MIELALVVAIVYQPLVLMISLVSYVLSADSGRYADTPMH